MKPLPKPSPKEQAESNELTTHIKKTIDQSNGYINFAKFMELALYTPKLGYYTATSSKFGEEGDFVTSPEISNLFGKSLAHQVGQVISDIHNADILEIGAGTGRLACDILQELERLDSLPQHYYILDISPDLCAKQIRLIEKECPNLLERVIWLQKLPENFRGVVIGNELLDAFPVHRFRIDGEDIKELCVTYNNNHFEWITVPPTDPAIEKEVKNIRKNCGLPDTYESEINLLFKPWFEKLADCLTEGVILLLDYGYGQCEYYHSDRKDGTLMCYYKHHFHSNPLILPGLQDITTHVNFTLVAEVASEKDLDVLGFTTQSAFLLSCGILEIAEKEHQDQVERYQQNFEIKTLTLPSQMGELVKVIALGKKYPHDLIGFSLHSRTRDL